MAKQSVLLQLIENEQALSQSIDSKKAELKLLYKQIVQIDKSLTEKIVQDESYANPVFKEAAIKLAEASMLLNNAKSEKVNIDKYISAENNKLNERISAVTKREKDVIQKELLLEIRDANTFRYEESRKANDLSTSRNEDSIRRLEIVMQNNEKIINKLTIIRQEISIQSESNKAQREYLQKERDAIYTLQKLYGANR